MEGGGRMPAPPPPSSMRRCVQVCECVEGLTGLNYAMRRVGHRSPLCVLSVISDSRPNIIFGFRLFLREISISTVMNSLVSPLQVFKTKNRGVQFSWTFDFFQKESVCVWHTIRFWIEREISGKGMYQARKPLREKGRRGE